MTGTEVTTTGAVVVIVLTTGVDVTIVADELYTVAGVSVT